MRPEAEYEETEEIKEKDKALYMQEFVRPFDLSCPPLFRVKFVKANKGNSLILFNMHHIVSDGVTVKILMDDFAKLYLGETLPRLSIFYKDYSEWLKIRNLRQQRAYWKREFSGEIPVLDLPLDYKRPKVQTFLGNTLMLNLGDEIKRQVKELCKKTGTTEYMAMLSVFMILLSKYGRQEELIVGSPVSGRIHKDTESIAGMFVNTIAIKGFPGRDKSFCCFLEEMKHKIVQAQENQEYPFDQLVEEVSVKREMSRNPLFDVLFSMQNEDINVELELPGVRLKDIPLPRNISKFDLSLFVIVTEDGYRLEMEYCKELFREESIMRMMFHFTTILKEVLKKPDQVIHKIDVTEEAERIKLLREFNRPFVIYEKDLTVVRLFEQRASEYYHKKAVAFEQDILTYGQLNKKVNALAMKLKALGIGRNDFVAVMAERRIETIIGIMAVLKAGGAYVPLDPDYPLGRIRYMVRDCSPRAILNFGPDAQFGLPSIDLSSALQWNEVEENPEAINTPEDLIYLIYTSGTSGKPKGAMIEHKSVIRLVNKANFVNLDESTVILQTGTLCFDAATFEIWGTLLNGGTLYLSDKEKIMDAGNLRAMIQAEKINTMWLTVSLFNQLAIEDVHAFDSLENLLIGGEQISEKHVRYLRENNPSIRIINGYGPTETTTFATTYPITDYPMEDNTPIGKPINNTQIYIADGDMLCGIGMPGEILIAGDGVARGYLNQPELTAKSFISNPFEDGKLYCSGDLGRWREDGNIEYLGRVDEQIKLRGFRIELREVEAVISKYQGIQDVVVRLKETDAQKILFAYVVAKDKVDIEKLRSQIRQELPDYMIPAAMLQIEKIPVTANGKTDMRALPEIQFADLHAYVAPANERENQIVALFEKVLGYSPVGMKDNFFEIGGDSIKAIRLVSKLKDLNYSISMREIVRLREVELIIKNLRKVENHMEYSQEEVTGIVEMSPVQRKFFSWKLPNPCHFNQCLMLQAKGVVNISAIKESLQALVKHHDMLRAVFSNGEQMIIRAEESGSIALPVFDVKEMDQETRSSFIENKNTEIQSSMDLSQGALIKAAVYFMEEETHLLICIHHLVVDGVSWRILLEDFENGYRQFLQKGEISLPLKTMSYRDWIQERKAYCNTEKVKSQKDYWKQIISQFACGRVEQDGKNRNSGYEIIKITMDEESTRCMLNCSAKTCKGDMNALLLTCLGIAARKFHGGNQLLVRLENHGRTEFTPQVCVSRTVGWFTSMYPVLIKVWDSLEDTLKNTMEMLNLIPDYGMGYDWFSKGDEDIDISFNYLGEIIQEKEERGYFIKSQYSSGTAVAKENIFSNIIFNCLIENGQFKIELWYDSSKFAQESMGKLLSSYEEALEEVMKYSFLIGFESNTPENSKREIRVRAENIFALKQYDRALLMETDLYKELLNYEIQMTKQTESCLKPFGYQKFFLENYPDNICGARIRIEGDLQGENLIKIVREIVSQQSIFRNSYDSKKGELCQFVFIDECPIPYVLHKGADSDVSIYESVIVHPELFKTLLSKIFVIKMSECCYELYFYVHHGLWDLASTEILGELIKEKLLGTDNLKARDVYTRYTMERTQREELNLHKQDLRNLIQRYFSYAKIFDFLLEGKTEKYQMHIKFRFNPISLEKILKDPIQWAVHLYCRMNMDELPEKTVPFLLMHFGREGTALKTAGLYLDIIPYTYERGTIHRYSSDTGNYGHLLFQKELFQAENYEKYFKRFPVVNFYADMETANVFEDFRDIDVEIKEILGGNEITMRIFKDIVYIAVPCIHNNVSHGMKIVKEVLG